jgi:hypothetical protein
MSGRHRAAHFGAMQHDRPAPRVLARMRHGHRANAGRRLAAIPGVLYNRRQGDGATTPAA